MLQYVHFINGKLVGKVKHALNKFRQQTMLVFVNVRFCMCNFL